MIPSVETIRDLLAAHVPADAGEVDSLHRILALVEGGSDPFSRTHYDPGHLTASGIVVNSERSKTLLIFHAKLHRWLQPGGHFEPGEYDPRDAAVREVLEETGLRTRLAAEGPELLDVDVHVIPARKTEPAHAHFDLRILLIAEPGIVCAADVVEARWCAPEEFAALSLDPGTLRALKKCGMAG